jgi:predicted RNA-binding protein with PUA-like domain
VAGIAEVASAAYPDVTQFDRKSPYYDAQSRHESPRWFNVDVRALRKTRLLPLDEMKRNKALAAMVTLRPGNRLSITPVTAQEWRAIMKALG